MPDVRGMLALVACLVIASPLSAQEPDRDRLLKAFEEKLTETVKSAERSIACVVVSRSELYPKTPGADAASGKLGGFDPDAFRKEHPTPEGTKLAKRLDLAEATNIPNHGYAGGVVIDPAGYVLTPYHVIAGAKKVCVFLPKVTKGIYANIHAADARSDLAVLKLINPPEKLQPIKLGEVRTISTRQGKATIAPGKIIILMAHPYSSTFKFEGPTAVYGSIMNVRHRISPPPGEQALKRRYTEFGTLLEYDLKMDPTPLVRRPNVSDDLMALTNVTGGVLLNLDGEMIGMTNAAAVAFGRDVPPGYAVPVDRNLLRIVEILRRGEEVEYGFLGVQTRTGGNPRQGPPAVEPMRGGGAALAGMQRGDVIRAIDGVPISSFDDLQLHIGSALAGSVVRVTVSRGAREIPLDVTLGKYNNDLPFIASVRPDPVFGIRVDHGSILAQQLRDQFVPPGVSIREVLPDSPAAKRFKQLGDPPATSWLVTQVDGTPVTIPSAFYKAARDQKTLKLTVFDPVNRTEREITIP